MNGLSVFMPSRSSPDTSTDEPSEIGMTKPRPEKKTEMIEVRLPHSKKKAFKRAADALERLKLDLSQTVDQPSP